MFKGLPMRKRCDRRNKCNCCNTRWHAALTAAGKQKNVSRMQLHSLLLPQHASCCQHHAVVYPHQQPSWLDSTDAARSCPPQPTPATKTLCQCILQHSPFQLPNEPGLCSDHGSGTPPSPAALLPRDPCPCLNQLHQCLPGFSASLCPPHLAQLKQHSLTLLEPLLAPPPPARTAPSRVLTMGQGCVPP